jgi:hypothetical protein
MIFGQDRVSCDDFSDYHDKITVAGIDLLADDQFVAFIYKGMSASGSSLRGQRLRVIDLIVDGRGEEINVSR